MPDQSNVESIETNVDPMSSPAVSPNVDDKESLKGDKLNRFFYFALTVAFAISTNYPMHFGAGLVRHGGMIFFSQFLVSSALVGLPLLLLETAMAQFSSRGAFFQFRRAVPVLGGLVSTMAFLLVVRITLQSAFLSHFGSLAISSFKGPSNLPWKDCTSLASDCFDPRLKDACYKNETRSSDPKCLAQALSLVLTRTGNERKTPFVSYTASTLFRHPQVLSEFSAPTHASWISLLIVWLMAATAVIWVDRWIKYAAPAVCLLSFSYYILQLAMSFTLDGSLDGLKSLWSPHWKALYSAEAWTDAVAHAVIAFNLANGGIGQISSLRSFSSPLRRDVALVVGCVLAFYVLVNLTTSAYVGHLADLAFADHPQSHKIKLLLEHRLHFLHFVYVESLTGFRSGWLWCALHFIVEYLRGLFLLITFLWILFDLFRDCLSPKKFDNEYKWQSMVSVIVGGTCASFFLVVPGGFVQLQVLEHFANVLTLVLAFAEVVLFSLGYGVKRLAVNLETMSASWKLVKYFYCVCWSLLTPLSLLTCVLMSAISAIIAPKPLPWIQSLLGWSLVCLAVSFSVFYAGLRIFDGQKKKDGWKAWTKPEPYWGPFSEEDRQLAVKKERTERVR